MVPLVELLLAGVAVRHQHKGGGVADEMVDRALQAISDRATECGISLLKIDANVFEENHSSQRMCRAAGLVHTGMTDAEGVQVWSMRLIV